MPTFRFVFLTTTTKGIERIVPRKGELQRCRSPLLSSPFPRGFPGFQAFSSAFPVAAACVTPFFCSGFLSVFPSRFLALCARRWLLNLSHFLLLRLGARWQVSESCRGVWPGRRAYSAEDVPSRPPLSVPSLLPKHVLPLPGVHAQT